MDYLYAQRFLWDESSFGRGNSADTSLSYQSIQWNLVRNDGKKGPFPTLKTSRKSDTGCVVSSQSPRVIDTDRFTM